MAAGRPREFDYDKALEQAMRVFWAKGYEGTSMPDLTEAMGLNRPSIYSAYGNKEELFRKALERYAETSQARQAELLAAPKLADAVEGFLTAAATSLSCTESPRGCMFVQGALTCGEDGAGAKQEASARREAGVALLHQRFKRALQEGELPAGTDTKDLARFYMTVLQGMSVQSSGGATKKDLLAVAKRALSALPS